MCPVPQISPDTALYLLLPGSGADGQEQRRCSLEELKELLNKLMLMSGKKDHHSAEAQVFSEVGSASGQAVGASFGARDALPSGPR